MHGNINNVFAAVFLILLAKLYSYKKVQLNKMGLTQLRN